MSTLLQLLANYYKSVIESERIYHENLSLYAPSSKESQSSGAESSSRVVEEMFLLQRQVTRLTAEIQALRRENDQLKELQITHKALMESKLNNSKKIIEKLKKEQRSNQAVPSRHTSTTPPPPNFPNRGQAAFHLLSPLNVRKLDGVGKQNHSTGAPLQPTGLREVLTTGHQTLFDDTIDNLSADRTDDVLFINSLKHKDKLAKIVLSNEEFSEDEDSQSKTIEKFSRHIDRENGITKKRKLARKRIQTVNSDRDE